MTRRIGRIVLVVSAVVFAILAFGPFLIPVPPLKGTLPPQALADPDSLFIQINDLDIHIKTMGQGEPVFVLLHGFGASLYSWQAVMEPLSQLGTVIAYDRPGFGLTERPLTWEGENPYGPEAQVDLVIALLDHFGVQQAILVGNSAGGAVSMLTALVHPERVEALILVDPAVNGGGAPAWVRPLFSHSPDAPSGASGCTPAPGARPELIEMAWHKPALLSPEMLALYQKPLKVDNWDKALWEFTLASRPSGLAERLNELTLPVLVITGDDDRIVPTEDSVRLAGELPNARLVVINNAGHVPHEEQPEAFMDAVNDFVRLFNKRGSILFGSIMQKIEENQ